MELLLNVSVKIFRLGSKVPTYFMVNCFVRSTNLNPVLFLDWVLIADRNSGPTKRKISFKPWKSKYTSTTGGRKIRPYFPVVPDRTTI